MGGKVYYRSRDGLNWGGWNNYIGELTSDMQFVVDNLAANSQGKTELIDFFEQEGNDVSINRTDLEKGSVTRGSII